MCVCVRACVCVIYLSPPRHEHLLHDQLAIWSLRVCRCVCVCMCVRVCVIDSSPPRHENVLHD